MSDSAAAAAAAAFFFLAFLSFFLPLFFLLASAGAFLRHRHGVEPLTGQRWIPVASGDHDISSVTATASFQKDPDRVRHDPAALDFDRQAFEADLTARSWSAFRWGSRIMSEMMDREWRRVPKDRVRSSVLRVVLSAGFSAGA